MELSQFRIHQFSIPLLDPMWLFCKSLLVVVVLLLTGTSAANAAFPSDNISHSYSSFGPENRNDFNFSADANDNQGALQITPDSINTPSYILNKSGRVLLSRTFRLWYPSEAGTVIASFNSTFSVNIYRPSNTTPPGEGLAFLIAPDAHGPPPGSHGGYLGLTNSTVDGKPSNRIVAVELDTVKQFYDPDDNHIGLNINSVVSNLSASLTPLGIQIAPQGAVNYTVWISYDGVSKQMRVDMAEQGNPRPTKPVLEAELDLSHYVNQDSYMGFAASTGSPDYQLNCVLAWDLVVQDLEYGDKNKKREVLEEEENESLSKRVGRDAEVPTGHAKEFDYKELWRATNGFDERMKLGQGGFGIVYKGVLAGEGAEIAVKRFSREDNMNSQDDFLKELTIINRLRHKHLVRLLGWCHKRGILLLVYDYMPNGSLDQHLYDGGGRPLLPWNLRVHVLSGLASSLHYLHNEYDECVVHRDIKSSNVMLDASFNARLGDFGLARVVDTGKTSYAELEVAGFPGTRGYIAPECFHTNRATRESDVFAFGALVLEVVAGRRPCCTDLPDFHLLLDWVWTLHRDGALLRAVDARLSGEFVVDEARRLLLLGLACSHPLPGERPKAASIVQILLGSVEPPSVPLFKPAFMWPVAVPFIGVADLTGARAWTLNASSSGWTPPLVTSEDVVSYD
ncbi:hypothetical protein HPP92_018261 [Vanilla planifolia]|uniref:non-specific serine/threonine protein kinase n=1 Tax=Vanilla planifolia TaxID=51239 RepID=A0A835QHQ3_VANPL|nr:hypothetical protein HPP92_018261 [Vanilla planifolia]